jgi:hypothetical protein
MTQEDSVNGEKRKVSHVCVFSFHFYIHVLDKKRTKIEPSSINDIFVGIL